MTIRSIGLYLLLLSCSLISDVTGETWKDKMKRVRDDLDHMEADAVVVTALDESACMCDFVNPVSSSKKDIYYCPNQHFFRLLSNFNMEFGIYILLYCLSPGLFNLRGSDIVYNPVFYAYTIIDKNDARLATTAVIITTKLSTHLFLISHTFQTTVYFIYCLQIVYQ